MRPPSSESVEKRCHMVDYELSEHARDMLRERDIPEDWVRLAVEDPQRKEPKDDGTVHYIRAIEQHGERFLRVVTNPAVKPQRVITVFFDRRIRRAQ